MTAVQYDGPITIAVGQSRRSTQWQNRDLMWSQLVNRLCNVTRSVSKMTEIEGRGGNRWDKPKKAEKSRDCGGGKF